MHANMKTDSQARKPLTEMQEKVLAYIQARVLDDGMPPTHEEIRCAFGLKSSYGVRQHLRLIRDKGYIDLCAGKSRGIRLQAPAREEPCGFREIPIVGQIAAGRPILAEEHLDGRIAISAELFPSGVLFALRVQGESMVDVGIRTGDLAVIRQQPHVENGQIAAVLREDEATLKRVYVFDNHVCLKAENDAEADMRIAKDAGVRVDILGRYVGLIRQTR